MSFFSSLIESPTSWEEVSEGCGRNEGGRTLLIDSYFGIVLSSGSGMSSSRARAAIVCGDRNVSDAVRSHRRKNAPRRNS